jgi:hypothetical protein
MVIGTHCLLYPLNLMRILWFNSEEVRTQKFRDRYGNMLLEVHTLRNSAAKYYHPMSLIRRILYVLIPTFFYKYQFL